MSPATSERKRRPRLDADERLRLAEAASGIGTFAFDPISESWDLSAQAALLLGLDNAPRSFEDWQKVLFADDVPKLLAAARGAQATGRCQAEFRATHANGGVRWLQAKGGLVADGGNRPILRGAFVDITERKGLEARLLAFTETLEARVAERARELATSNERLGEFERRFRLLVEAVTDYAIFMLDRDGRVISWNPGAERIKGYAPYEIIGQEFSRFYTAEERANGGPQRALETAARTGKYETEGWRVRKDGSLFWASVVINAIHDSAHELVGFAKVTHDLTERRLAEERMRQAQKMEALGQLTGGVAHDFNNVLTVISGNIEALQRRLPQPADDLRHFAEVALRGTERAAMLVRQLLAYSRRQPLEPKPLSVAPLISGVSEMLRRSIGERIALETVTGAGVWAIFADANQLESALLNLAINARDAMPEGGRLTIEAVNTYLDQATAVAAEIAPGDYVCIAVSDSGTGMGEDVAAKAFDPFFTTKPPGQGTGLGLSQVFGFIKQSGGHVRIFSKLGVGTTVKLYLPRHHAGDVDEEDERGAHIPRGRGETILVVEDDVDVREATVDMLRELGYRVIEAPEGGDGLRLLERHREIGLLITDIGLPGGMNGRELADEARRRRVGLKVLFTSGYAQSAVVHHGRLDPGIELLSKPFTFSALGARVRHLLDG